MRRAITIAAALTALAGLVAGGVYIEHTGGLQFIGSFSQDYQNKITSYRSPNGEKVVMLFDAGDSLVGRWERIMPARYGDQAGTVHLDNGESFHYSPGDTAVLSIVTLTPSEIRMSFIHGNDSRESGDVFFVFDDCTPDDPLEVARRIDPQREHVEHIIEIFSLEGDSLLARALISPATHANFVLKPGAYQVYVAHIDEIGVKSDFFGPIIINSGGCP